MMNDVTLRIVFLSLSMCCFFFGTLNPPTPRVNFVSLGLFFFIITLFLH
jgi:hypothetical protein